MKPLAIIITCSFFLSCSKSPTSSDSKVDDRIQLSYNSADSSEARDIAVWAEAKLVPSDSAVSEILYNINYLRYCFKDSVSLKPLLSPRFLPPWTTNSIAIKFDPATAELVRNKTYTGWSLLSTQAKPDSVEPPDALQWSLLSYSHHRNPWRLCEIIAKLPGVVNCEPNGRGFAGGTFPIFTGMRNGQITYIFVESYIYMPEAHHYFYYENNKPVYAGVWSTQQNPKPSWWQNVKTSIDSFYYWGKYK